MSSKGKRPEPKTFFFCDRKKCSNCNPQCRHTSDPSHAIRLEGKFRQNTDGNMWQTDISLDGVHYSGNNIRFVKEIK